jgi:hypothetical protein
VVGQFFDDYYSAIAAAGITFTKCDNMAALDNLASAFLVTFSGPGSDETIGEGVDIPSIRRAYKNAVKEAARKWFGDANVIWCMGMTPRVLLGDEIGLPRSTE